MSPLTPYQVVKANYKKWLCVIMLHLTLLKVKTHSARTGESPSLINMWPLKAIRCEATNQNEVVGMFLLGTTKRFD